jgi:hypothetical protein
MPCLSSSLTWSFYKQNITDLKIKAVGSSETSVVLLTIGAMKT